MDPRSRAAAADLSLLAATFVWGSTFVLVQDALGDASPSAFLAVRFLAASAAFLPALALRGELRGLLSRPLLLRGAALGLLVGGAFLLQTWGLRFTAPSRSAYITCLYVLLVPFFYVVVEGRRPGLGPAVGSLLAAAGLTLLYRPGVTPPNLGDLLTFGCSLLFAAQILLVDRFAPRHGAFLLTAVQTAAAVPVFAAGLLVERLRFVPSRRLLLALLVTSVLATTAAFTVQVWAQRWTTPVRAAVVFSAEPVFAALISAGLGRESFGLREGAGGLLIVAGMLAAVLGGSGARAGGPDQPAPSEPCPMG